MRQPQSRISKKRSDSAFRNIEKILADNHLFSLCMRDKGGPEYAGQANHINANLRATLIPAIRNLSIEHSLAVFDLIRFGGKYSYVCKLDAYDHLVQQLQIQTLERFRTKHLFTDNSYQTSTQSGKPVSALDTLARLRPLMQHGKPFNLPKIEAKPFAIKLTARQRAVSSVMFAPAPAPVITNAKPSPHVLMYLSLLESVQHNKAPERMETVLGKFFQGIVKQPNTSPPSASKLKRTITPPHTASI